MKMVLLLMLLCAAAAPLPLSRLLAQDKDKICTDLQTRPMRVGQWAGYRWTGGRADGGKMRMALVGTEAVAGTPNYWYEIAYDDPKKANEKTIIQILVPGLGFQAASVRGLIMKSGQQPAMRMPEEAVRMMGGRMEGGNYATEFARKCQEMTVVGWEQVTVPAGSFRALHIRDAAEQVDAWLLPDLYFGLLRAKLKDGSSMELTGRGADAKSSITETPQTMPFPR